MCRWIYWEPCLIRRFWMISSFRLFRRSFNRSLFDRRLVYYYSMTLIRIRVWTGAPFVYTTAVVVAVYCSLRFAPFWLGCFVISIHVLQNAIVASWSVVERSIIQQVHTQNSNIKLKNIIIKRTGSPISEWMQVLNRDSSVHKLVGKR